MPVISTQKVTVLPAGMEIAAGNVSDLINSSASGQNTAIGSSYETVSRLGGIRNELYKYPLQEDTGQQIKLVSTSTTDNNSGGDAARKIMIRGLGPNAVEQVEVLPINGTTQVTSNMYWTAVEILLVHQTGSGGDTNAGDITAYANDGTTALVQMATGEGLGSGAFKYCPAGKNVYLTQFFASAINEAEIAIFSRRNNKGWQARQTIFLKDNAQNYVSELPIQLREGDAMEVRAIRLGDTDAKVSVDFQVAVETV